MTSGIVVVRRHLWLWSPALSQDMRANIAFEGCDLFSEQTGMVMEWIRKNMLRAKWLGRTPRYFQRHTQRYHQFRPYPFSEYRYQNPMPQQQNYQPAYSQQSQDRRKSKQRGKNTSHSPSYQHSRGAQIFWLGIETFFFEQLAKLKADGASFPHCGLLIHCIASSWRQRELRQEWPPCICHMILQGGKVSLSMEGRENAPNI